ncbi:extracellular solute-binding protein [Bacillaceae bacterium SIJ1]|uniref:extracellular solute-binding protein n=1 Tax=Litoribacterium kuwaitense TaxID=1398745 RepID=UPI0013EC007E|nr:extracellular solute-binding protein [Litoribacterium kuwaitense]NGP43830.1 extracellular solute-binding protein [Litoribacterium kuwaitense]
MIKNAAIASLFIILFIVSACGNNEAAVNQTVGTEEALQNLNESGFPIVNEEIQLDVFVGKNASYKTSLEDVKAFAKYEEMTNVDIQWDEIAVDVLAEKRNLALGGGQLPDAFYAAGISSLDLLKYGQQGTFIKLNDLIDEYAPNLKKLMDEDPQIEKSIMSADGNIYGFPRILDPDFLSLRLNPMLFHNKDWLDELGMDVPETTDEYYEYLKGIKENDVNQNGDSNDEIPYGGTSIVLLVNWLKGSYGIGNKGDLTFDLDPETDEMRFIPVQDGYKELLQYVHKLYSEELIAQDIFSIEWNTYLANAIDGKYGSTVFYSPDELLGETGESFVNGLPLIGPDGDQELATSAHPVFNLGTFTITSENENPEATVRWIDHFYSDEGAKLIYLGVEGESYEETEEGDYEFLDHIVNDPELTKEQVLAKYAGYLNMGAPPSILKQDFFKGSESSEMSLKAAEQLKPYVTEDTWPPFQYTEEESRIISTVGNDIDKYVGEMRDKFIIGEVSFDVWDEYVETIEKMGLSEYIEVRKSALERIEG